MLEDTCIVCVLIDEGVRFLSYGLSVVCVCAIGHELLGVLDVFVKLAFALVYALVFALVLSHWDVL